MKNICRISIALFLPLLFCAPVKAQHSGPFVGVFAGGNALMNAKSTDDLGNFGLTFDPALHGSGVIGWDFEPGNPAGEGRVELEYTRRSNKLDQVKFVEGSFKGSGNLSAESLLLNVFGVLHDNSRLAPYVGIGLGAVRIDASGLKVNDQPLCSSGSSTVFAYQLGAGFDIALTDYLNLDLGYRFFSSIRPKFTEVSGRKFEMDYFSHNMVLGVRAGF